MKTFRLVRTHFLLGALILASCSARVLAQVNSSAKPAAPSAGHDGQHDFDFEHGTWKIHLSRLLERLAGSTTWVDFDGVSFTRKIWDGRSQVEQFETDSTSGHIEGLTLRLYNPQSHQWRLYWANSKDGILDQPMIGEFRNGRGEFIDQEPFNGRSILVRFLWSDTTTTTPHFEQSFSDDGGKTWEVNWITNQTRVSEEPDKGETDHPQAQPGGGMAKTETQKPGAERDGQHDFDFEFGSWSAHLKRLLHPLSGSNEWVEYDGTSVVRKLWDGRANLGELEVGNATAHIEGLTLRLYHPQSHQWSLHWANSKDGILNVPAVGSFNNGRGEFFDQEEFQGKSILVRFVFSDITSNSFRGEQSFSADGGKTWEVNWISNFTRQPQ